MFRTQQQLAAVQYLTKNKKTEKNTVLTVAVWKNGRLTEYWPKKRSRMQQENLKISNCLAARAHRYPSLVD
jgi:hypothetical protein